MQTSLFEIPQLNEAHQPLLKQYLVKCSGGIKLETMKGTGLLAAAMAFAAMGEMPTDVELNDNRPTPYSKTLLTKSKRKRGCGLKLQEKVER